MHIFCGPTSYLPTLPRKFSRESPGAGLMQISRKHGRSRTFWAVPGRDVSVPGGGFKSPGFGGKKVGKYAPLCELSHG